MDNVGLDRTFSDKASGNDAKRPQLEALMTFVRAGDTVVVYSMDRLKRAVQALTNDGPAVDDALLRHLSPLGWEHINLTGD